MSKMYYGSQPITRMYKGNTEIFREYHGAILRWEKPVVEVLNATIRSTTLEPQPYNGNGNKTISKPAGTQAGDLLVFFASGDSGNASTYSIPSGWTEMFKYTATGPKYMAAYKVAGSNEPSSYSFNMSSSSDSYSVMHAVMNANTGVAPSYNSGPTPSSKTVHTAPSVTPVSNRGLLISYASMHGGSSSASFSWTPPTGMTEESDVSMDGWISLSTASQRWDSSSATGTRAFGVTTSVTARAGYASTMFIPSI